MSKIKILLVLVLFTVSCSGIGSEVSNNLNTNNDNLEESIEEALPSVEGIPQLGEKSVEGIYKELSNTCDINLEKIGIEIDDDGQSWLYGLDRDEISVEMIEDEGNWIVFANDMTCEVVFEESFGDEISHLEIKCKGESTSCEAEYEKISDVFDIYEIYPTLHGDTVDLDFLVTNIMATAIQVDESGEGGVVSLVHDDGLIQFYSDSINTNEELFPSLEVSLFDGKINAFSDYKYSFSKMNVVVLDKDHIYDVDSKTVFYLEKDPISKTEKKDNQLMELVAVATNAVKPKVIGDYLFWIDSGEYHLKYVDKLNHNLMKSISLPLEESPNDYALLEDDVFFVYRDEDNAEVYKSHLVGMVGRNNVFIWSHYFPGRSNIQIQVTESNIFINDSDSVAILDDYDVATDYHLPEGDSIVSAKAYGIHAYLFCESGALYIISAPGGHLGKINYIQDIFVEKNYYKSKAFVDSDDPIINSYLDSSPKSVLDFISFGLEEGKSLIMLVSKEGGEGLYLNHSTF